MTTLKKEQLFHIAAAIRPLDQVKQAYASYEAGFLGSKFYNAGSRSPHGQRLLNDELLKIRAHEQAHFVNTKHIREAAQLAAETIGSSKGAKVRHDKVHLKIQRISKRLQTLRHPIGKKTLLDSRRGHDNHEAMYASTEQHTARILPLKHEKAGFVPDRSPVSVHLQKRDWSGQYRAQVITQPPVSSAPDANIGERFTEKLTTRSVSKIFEAGAYVAQCHDGFTTFITLTFSIQQRMALFGAMAEAEGRPFTPIEFVRDKGTLIYGKDGWFTQLPEKPFKIVKVAETTMGREVSRFLDGCKKMYQRGWETESGHKIAPHYKAKLSEFGPDREKADFHYVWVAECPPSKDPETGEIIGEPNPHVHLIVRWSVDKAYFQDWAKRLESLWGQGMAHIEWIKQPKAASTYLIKALGYAAKGENADQGLIRGNRYNIARCSRAPAWETLATFEAHNITAVIRECGYKLEQWKKPIQRTLNRINTQKAQTVKAAAIAKKQNKPEEVLKKLQARIIRLEHAARKTKQSMKERGVHVSSSNRFSITFDGKEDLDAKEQLDNFLYWACGARGWSMELIGAHGQYDEALERHIYGTLHDIDLSDIRQEAKERYQNQYQQFLNKQAYWESVRKDSFPEPPDEDEVNYWRTVVANEYEGRQMSQQRRFHT